MVMKHFLALALADGPRERLVQLSERLRQWNLPARWVHPEDYHITVRFLGELDAVEAAAVPCAVELVAPAIARPALTLCGLGASGGRTEPRVVYAALADSAHRLAELHYDLSGALGLEPERAFLPHVTLCRPDARARNDCSGPPRGDWPQLLEANGQADWGACETTELVLYQSRAALRPRYHALARWRLAS